MARSKALPDLSGREKNALMPVSPSDESSIVEGLSRDGETAEEAEEAEMDEAGSERGDEVQEGRMSKGQKPPKEPTKAEREEHERTHCPYRSWCKHCVKSRARNSPHRNCTPEEPLETEVAQSPSVLLLHVSRR